MKKRPESGFPYSTEYLNRTQASPLPLPEEEAPTLGFAPLSDEDEIRQELLSWMLIHEGTAEGVVPDTEGSDALFLENFISPEMADDFPLILHEFLKHRGAAVLESPHTEWADECPGAWSLEDTLQRISLNAMFGDAVSGDEYSRELFRVLYKTYYRSEYRQLKRFRTLSVAEAISLAEGADGHTDMLKLARTLTMARFFDIKPDKACAYLHSVLGRYHDKSVDLDHADAYEFEYPDGLYPACREQVERWMESVKGTVVEAPEYHSLRLAEDFLGHAFLTNGFSEFYHQLFYEQPDDLRRQLAHSLAILRMLEPGREWTFDEVQLLTPAYACACSLSDGVMELTENIGLLLDPHGTDFYEEFPPLFEPEKLKAAKAPAKGGAASGPRPQNAAPPADKTASSGSAAAAALPADERAVLEQEIERLRSELRRERTAVRAAREELREKQRQTTELAAELASLTADRAELTALREHVYRLTMEEPKDSALSEEEMLAAIRARRIILIGGHPNWTKKLKDLCPDWIFLDPNASGAVDEKLFANAAHVYFFTDTLSHKTYSRFIRIVRSRDLPFGYIHSVNIAANIRQVYEETVARA